MSTNALSLSDLHDIVMPEPASAWPPAPGVWVVSGLILLIAGMLFFRWFKTYRKNAYRRAALAELEQAGSVAEMGEILRRTAIQAFGREAVIELQGEAWFQWLEAQPGLQIPEKVRRAWRSIYSSRAADSEALRDYVGKWVREHSC